RSASFGVVWELMHPAQLSMDDTLAILRRRFGNSSLPRLPVPMPLLRLGAWAGDAAAWLGWRPPIRSTALAELVRGVSGDPGPWMAAAGIAPRSLDDFLRANPVTVQERWFARLYMLKALIVAALAVFWCVSGVIALTVAFEPAMGILTKRGWSKSAAEIFTAV